MIQLYTYDFQIPNFTNAQEYQKFLMEQMQKGELAIQRG